MHNTHHVNPYHHKSAPQRVSIPHDLFGREQRVKITLSEDVCVLLVAFTEVFTEVVAKVAHTMESSEKHRS